MAEAVFDRFKVIDIDTHITEPPDLWTSRVASKWGDAIPHVERNANGSDFWVANGHPLGLPGLISNAGNNDYPPNWRKTYDDIPKSMYDSNERLKFMDEEDIYGAVLYPNVGGFGSQGYRAVGDDKLMIECIRAYNDFLVDWCSPDSNRLKGVAAMPFWDLDACVAEIQRCAKLGFKAILQCNMPEAHGMPPLRDKHWDKYWAAAEECGMTVNFHVGGGDNSGINVDNGIGYRANFARFSILAFVDNVHCILNMITGGVCHRFPDLKLVSVESGVGWIPFMCQALDWQWHNNGVAKEHPEYDLLPSEYFKRQIYGSFWFEEEGVADILERFPDNIMYETDYPHPTCMHPGAASVATRPKLYAERALSKVSEPTLEKVMYGTAAKLYGIV